MGNKRIAVNVFATYGQNMVSLVVGLLCSRWVYLALGEENFGVFAVVGSLMGFIAFFNSTMSNSVARHYAYAIGEGRGLDAQAAKDRLCEWFNTAIGVHTILPVALVVLGYPIGAYAIHNWLVIPPSQIEASIWVFRFSLVATFISMLSVPFRAIFEAKQLIFVRNLFETFQMLLAAVEGWWLLHYAGGRLFAHAFLVMTIILFVNMLFISTALRCFPECRLKPGHWSCMERLKRLLSYAMYGMLGDLGALFANQGVALVLNLFHGPRMNSAMGIGNQVSSKVAMLSQAVVSSVSPEVTSRVGANDVERARRLGVRVCFYATALSIVVMAPIVVYMDDLLLWWLKTPPQHASRIALIMIGAFLVDKPTVGYMMLVHASGKIRGYQITLGILTISTVFLIWGLLSFGCSVTVALGVGYVIPKALVSLGRILFARRILAVPLRSFLDEVLLPILALSVPLFASAYLLSTLVPSRVIGFVLVTLCDFLLALVLVILLLSRSERGYVLDKARSFLSSRKRKGSASPCRRGQ